MKLSGGLIAPIDTGETRKKLRYLAVGLAFLPIGQGLIQLLGPWLDNYTVASLLAASIASVPNFFANKRYVWRVRGGENVRSQVLVFWVVMMLAVGLATLFTFYVDRAMVRESAAVHGATVFAVQVLAFGMVWIGRYLIMDRWFLHQQRR